MDRRFWSGAVIAVTVVIAGANALPALLLGPPADAPPVLPVPVIAAVPTPAARPELPVPIPRAANTEPAPRAAVTVASAPVTPAATPAAVAPTPVAAAPEPRSAPASLQTAPASQPPPSAETASAFPPVQPPSAEPPPTGALALPATRTPHVTEKPTQTVEPKERKRQRSVRPAVYPMREFLAWRRP